MHGLLFELVINKMSCLDNDAQKMAEYKVPI